MIIFWYSPGSTKEVTFKWLFFLSNELKIVISFIKQFKTHDITTYIKEIVIQFSLCLYEQQSYFSYQQVALNPLFQMRYDSLANSKKQRSDSQRG